MQIYDTVKDETLELDTEGLINIMIEGRQVDIYCKSVKTDADGYISWDVEHWSAIDTRRFIRTYTLNGKVLTESTGHNIDDVKNEFKPMEALKVELS